MINIRKNCRSKCEITYCLLLSFIYLLICTKSSPLYPLNDWVDSNAFFTMGKGMMNGKVLYRDLFEQKGPLLYFIHGISYLISNKTFFGVFIFEVLSFTVFLCFCNKSLKLFIDVKYSYISLVFVTYIVLNMPSFSHGDSAEEFSISLLSISLYFLLNYFSKIYPKELKYENVLVNGIIAGCILWIKYSMLGFWLGWMASIFFCLINTKNYSYAFKCCFVFLLGMLISTIPWIFYFGINNSISDLFYVYFYVNINSYSQEISILFRIINALANAIFYSAYNTAFGVIFIFGLMIFIICDKFIKLLLHRICLLMCIFLLTIGVFGGGIYYTYYYLIYSPFIVLGIVTLIDLIQFLLKNNKMLLGKVMNLSTLCLIFITIVASLLFNHNVYMMKLKKDELVQYKFAKIISETKDATILNYDVLDLGIYTVTGITPTKRFFQKNNFDYIKFPLIFDEQNNYIKENSIDYVIMVRYNLKDNLKVPNPYLFDKYNLILSDIQIYENIEYEYLLFEKK